MSLADDVSIIALVISLVALFISLLQLSQSFLGTAEGYRRCAESVLGAWHNLRHRHFRLSEFRFETQYVTPQILIVSDYEFEEASEQHEIYHLTSNSTLDCPDCPEIKDTVHKNVKLTRPTVKEITQNESDPEKADAVAPGTRAVIGEALSTFMSTLMPESMQRRRRRARANELLVTWLGLLKELHKLYYSYSPDDCQTCFHADVDIGWTVADINHVEGSTLCFQSKQSLDKGDGSEFRLDSHDEKTKERESNTDRTNAAVIYRQWTWDFMPPEMVRPLAEATVGDVVVLARRMNMQWRDLDLNGNKLQAEGNGYSLTSNYVNGLGIVLRFSSFGRPERFPRVVPSKAGDKLICGIVPGCSDMVKRDFDIVRPDRTVAQPHAPGGVLSQLGVPEQIRAEVARENFEESDSECLMLLCSFIPLSHSNLVCYNFFGLRPNHMVRKSVFHFWEGRWALFHRLGQRLEDKQRSTKHQDLVDIYELFKSLEQEQPHDFYCRWGRAKIVHSAVFTHLKEEDRAKAKEGLVKFCRDIFNQTTRYLQGPGRQMHEKDTKGQTKYLHLVAAHVAMGRKAIRQALNFVDHQPKEQRDQRVLREKYGFQLGYHGNFVFQQQVEIGFRYADYVRNPDHGIKRYLYDRGLEFSDDEAEAMWWCLMLRGIAWDMSSWHTPDAGIPIPAMFYGDKTPVWIT